MRAPRKPGRENMFFVDTFGDRGDIRHQVLCDEGIGQLIVFDFSEMVYGDHAEIFANDMCARLNDAVDGWLFNWRNP